jgi:hypothetical protein
MSLVTLMPVLSREALGIVVSSAFLMALMIDMSVMFAMSRMFLMTCLARYQSDKSMTGLMSDTFDLCCFHDDCDIVGMVTDYDVCMPVCTVCDGLDANVLLSMTVISVMSLMTLASVKSVYVQDGFL